MSRQPQCAIQPSIIFFVYFFFFISFVFPFWPFLSIQTVGGMYDRTPNAGTGLWMGLPTSPTRSDLLTLAKGNPKQSQESYSHTQNTDLGLLFISLLFFPL